MNERSRHIKRQLAEIHDKRVRREERDWLMEKLWQLCSGTKEEIELLQRVEEYK